MGNNGGNGMGDFSGLVFNTSHSGGSEMRNSYGGNSRGDETMAIGKRDTIDSIGFSLTLFASPISIRMGISIRGNMGNNWGDGMCDLSGLVFNISNGGGPGYRNSDRGYMRKTVMIEKLRISLGLTLFASIPSPIIRVGMGRSG
jgi:hypothetical protein